MIMSSHVGLWVSYRSLALAYIGGQRGERDDHVLPRGPGATNRSLALAYIAGQRGVRDDHVLPRGPGAIYTDSITQSRNIWGRSVESAIDTDSHLL